MIIGGCIANPCQNSTGYCRNWPLHVPESFFSKAKKWNGQLTAFVTE